MSDIEYHNLCLQVTKRVTENRIEGKEKFSKIFSRSKSKNIPQLDLQKKKEELIAIAETNRVTDYSPVSNNLDNDLTQAVFNNRSPGGESISPNKSSKKNIDPFKLPTSVLSEKSKMNSEQMIDFEQSKF